MTEINCIDCGRIFTQKVANQKRCSACKNILTKHFFVVRQMRKDFAVMAKLDPRKARKILNEMVESEGKEFTKKCLGNIYYLVSRGKYEFQKSNSRKLDKRTKDVISNGGASRR